MYTYFPPWVQNQFHQIPERMKSISLKATIWRPLTITPQTSINISTVLATWEANFLIRPYLLRNLLFFLLENLLSWKLQTSKSGEKEPNRANPTFYPHASTITLDQVPESFYSWYTLMWSVKAISTSSSWPLEDLVTSLPSIHALIVLTMFSSLICQSRWNKICPLQQTVMALKCVFFFI